MSEEEKFIPEEELGKQKHEQTMDELHEEANAINWTMDQRIISPDLIKEMRAEDLERFAGYYRDFHAETKVVSQEFKPNERNGYPSDQCLAIVYHGDQISSALIKVIEYYNQEELAKKKISRISSLISGSEESKHNEAIEYRSGEAPDFKAEISFLNPEELEKIKNQTGENKTSLAELHIDGNETSAMKAIGEVAQGYVKGFVETLVENRQIGQRIKSKAIEIFRECKGRSIDELTQAFNRAALMESSKESKAYLALNNISLLHNEGYLTIKDSNKPFKEFRVITDLFASQDALRMLRMYDKRLEIIRGHRSMEEVMDIPKKIICQGTRLAEIGGDFIYEYKQYGAEIAYTDRNFSIGEMGGIKDNETQITLNNYEKHYPGEYDVTLSRQVMDPGSGIQTGFSGAREGSRNLMAVFANITREGGISIHQGGAVPTDEAFLEELGLELLYSFDTQPDKTHLFFKKNDKKIEPEQLREIETKIREKMEKEEK